MELAGMPAQEANTRDSSLVHDLPMPVLLSNTLRLLFVDTDGATDSEDKTGRDSLFCDKAL